MQGREIIVNDGGRIMRYNDDLIEEIRMKNDIVDVVSAYVRLQKKGSTYFGLCPFHNEKSPSFSVTPSKQMYYCFGCGAGGNVFTFVMEYENFTFPEALKMLGERAGIRLTEQEDSPEAKRQADLKETLLEIHREAAKYYYYQLKHEKGIHALHYFKERGLSDETITKFGLGYSGRTGGELYRFLRGKGYTDEILKQTGLVTIEERGSRDKFWNRAMFPIMDTRNRVIGFGGRVMGEGEPKYLNSPETKIFDKSRNLYGLNFARSARKPYMIICEGYMDVIALQQAGFQNAVASLGTAFTSQQASLLKRYTEEVILAYDSDGAGVKAALRAIPLLKQAGLSARVLQMQPAKDPDEFIKTYGTEAFEERIAAAKNSFLFEVEVKQKEFNMEDPEQKTKFYKEAAKMLLEFPEEIERNNYIEAISRQYQISFDSLKSMVNKYGYQLGNIQSRQEPKRNTQKTEKGDGIKKSQRLLLTWMIEDTRLFERLKGIISPRDFTENFYYMVAEMLFEQYEKEQKVNPARIISHFTTEEEQREVAALFNTALHGEMTVKEKEKALNETVKKIKAYWCEYSGEHVTEISELMEISQVKRSLQDLHISLE